MDLNKFEQAVVYRENLKDLKKQLEQWKVCDSLFEPRIKAKEGGYLYPCWILQEEFVLLKNTVINRLERDLKYLEDQFNSL